MKLAYRRAGAPENVQITQIKKRKETIMSQSDNSNGMASGIAMMEGAVGLVTLAVLLLIMVFYLLTLQKALTRCAPENRAMAPGMVWLQIIPLLGMVWQFFNVINIAKSLGAEFQKRGMAEDPEPGKKLGLVMCILVCCTVIPILGLLASIGALICWVMYWIKIAGYSKKLA
jgi:hypothetical protein